MSLPWFNVWLFWLSLEKEEMVDIILPCDKATTRLLINCCYQNLTVSCLLRVRSVSFTSRAKGCIKFVPHRWMVYLSHKIGVFLEEAICYFIGTGYKYDRNVFVAWVLQVRRAEVVTKWSTGFRTWTPILRKLITYC